jgi:hypothetical protein
MWCPPTATGRSCVGTVGDVRATRASKSILVTVAASLGLRVKQTSAVRSRTNAARAAIARRVNVTRGLRARAVARAYPFTTSAPAINARQARAGRTARVCLQARWGPLPCASRPRAKPTAIATPSRAEVASWSRTPAATAPISACFAGIQAGAAHRTATAISASAASPPTAQTVNVTTAGFVRTEPHIVGCQSAASRFFHRKIRRAEDEYLGFALPPAGLVRRCAPNGAARNFTFCPPDLPVKLSEVLATSYQQLGAGGAEVSSARAFDQDQARSKRSRFITFVHAATKSRTSFSLASALA